jgi:hypothetical protein
VFSEAERRIEEARSTGAEKLDLSNLGLSVLPEWLGGLSQLTALSLSGNGLSVLPEWLGGLSQLTGLDLSFNKLSVLPEWLGGLSQLTWLDLSGNELSVLPESLADLNLRALHLKGNPLAPELLAAYREGQAELFTLLRLLRSEGVRIRQAKLVLAGEGAVGKSSLLATMRGEPWVAGRKTTHGIEVKEVTVPADGGEIQLNGWDFGGQPDYRPTHQLFFTAPAVYLVVWSPRLGPEASAVDFWIEMIRRRAGEEARIHVVATHADGGQRGAWIDEAALQRRFGAMIVGFHHVDSETGLGVPGLMAAIGATAASLPHVTRRYPASWLRLRDEIRKAGHPYLTYEEYAALAEENGLSPTSARSLATSSNALGYWIHYGDDPGLADLVIFKPDWLSTAVSLVLDDPLTRKAGGLLAHRRLTHIWNDPKRPPGQRYPDALHPLFLYLMEKFDISYRVASHSPDDEPTSLVAQLVGGNTPDLTEAWDAYGPGLPELTYVCELRDDQDVSTPIGLMYRLIVRFHRYSLGRHDHARSRHWQNGLVLDDGYNGRALLTLDRKRLVIKVRAAYPDYLLHRLSAEIREHNRQFWPGLRTRVLVPCGESCGRQRPGSGLFDVELLIRVRKRGRDDIDCQQCYEPYSIDSLLRGGVSRPSRRDEQLVAAVAAALRPGTEAILDEVRAQGLRNLTATEQLSDEVKGGLSRLEERFYDLVTALEDESRNGPRLMTVTYQRSLKPGYYRLQVTLWCEHSRMPVPELSPGRGVYDIDVPRDWLVKAAPLLKAITVVLRGVLPIAVAGIELTQPDPQAWQRTLSAQLAHAERSLDALGDATDLVDAGPDRPGRRPRTIGRAGPVELDGGLLRILQAQVGERDRDFGGLVRVRTRNSYLWVHPRFESEYHQPLPEIPTGK